MVAPTPDRPRSSPLGWFVELPAPAGSVLERVGAGAPGADSDADLDAVAAAAQACVYLFEAERLAALLARLSAGTPEHRRLGHALAAEDAVRRGDVAGAREHLAGILGEPGPLGAWARLRDVDALERMGKVEEAEQALAATRGLDEEPPLLRALVEARLEFRKGVVGKAAEVLQAASQEVAGAPAPLAGAYERAFAIYLGLTGDLPRAILHHRNALEVFRQLGDQYMLAKEYLSLGQSYQDGDELDHAEFFLRKAAAIVEELGNEQLEGLLASRLGMLAFARGDFAGARALFERDLALCLDAGFRHGQSFARRNLGRALLHLGNAEHGAAMIDEAAKGFAAHHDAFNHHLTELEAVAARLAASPDATDAQGDEGAFGQRLDEVTAFFRRADREELLPQVEVVRARLYVQQGKPELGNQAMAAGGRALLAQRRPERFVEAALLFAEACERRGERRAAVEHLAWAYRESVRAARPGLGALVLERLGRLDERAVMDLAGPGGTGLPAATPTEPPEQFERFLLASRSPAARSVVAEARRVAPTDETVLIEGETGVGKGILARFIHSLSRRAEAAFLAVNCGAIAESLLEAELFGHEKGAFTGAEARRVGILEAADGGVVFLDEVGELSPRAQVTLLRFLEDRQVRPVGSSTSRRVDVRVVAATNRDLAAEVRAGRFRADLYYRLAVYPIRVPPLRERLADLPELVGFILAHAPAAQDRGITGVTKGALRRLAAHAWPGNLRELDNVLRAAAIRCAGKKILGRDLSPSLGELRLHAGAFPTLAEMTERHVAEALRLADGNQSRAAALLGVHRNTLGARLRGRG